MHLGGAGEDGAFARMNIKLVCKSAGTIMHNQVKQSRH